MSPERSDRHAREQQDTEQVELGHETDGADHAGVIRATVAYRPLATFSTFSMWRSEQHMLDMVRGRNAEVDGASHRDAMKERVRKDFHHEFTTMRLIPISEHGQWPETLFLPAG